MNLSKEAMEEYLQKRAGLREDLGGPVHNIIEDEGEDKAVSERVIGTEEKTAAYQDEGGQLSAPTAGLIAGGTAGAFMPSNAIKANELKTLTNDQRILKGFSDARSTGVNLSKKQLESALQVERVRAANAAKLKSMKRGLRGRRMGKATLGGLLGAGAAYGASKLFGGDKAQAAATTPAPNVDQDLSLNVNVKRSQAAQALLDAIARNRGVASGIELTASEKEAGVVTEAVKSVGKAADKVVQKGGAKVIQGARKVGGKGSLKKVDARTIKHKRVAGYGAAGAAAAGGAALASDKEASLGDMLNERQENKINKAEKDNEEGYGALLDMSKLDLQKLRNRLENRKERGLLRGGVQNTRDNLAEVRDTFTGKTPAVHWTKDQRDKRRAYLEERREKAKASA